MGLSWRSSTLTSVNLDADLGANYDIDVLALIGVNLDDDATRTPVIDDTAGFGSPLYAPGSSNAFDLTNAELLPHRPNHGRNLIILPGSTITGRYTRITLNDSGNPDNYLAARTYWAGPIWQPPWGINEASELSTLFIGQAGVERYLRKWRIVFNALTRAEQFKIKSVLLAKLRSGVVLLIPHPTVASTFVEEAIMARMVGEPSIQMMASFPYWTVEVEFLEVGV